MKHFVKVNGVADTATKKMSRNNIWVSNFNMVALKFKISSIKTDTNHVK